MSSNLHLQPALYPEANLGIAMIDLLPDFVIISQDDCTILEWNRQAEEVFGVSRQEAIGRSVKDTIATTPFTQNWIDQLQRNLSEDGYWEGDFPFHPANESQQWFFIRARRTQWHDDSPAILIVSTFLTRHELRHEVVQKALDYSQKELSHILSAVDDVVCKYSPAKQAVLFISPSCFKLTGYTEYEMVDRPALFLDMIAPDFRSEVEAAFQQAQPGSITKLEYLIRRKDGQECWVRNSITPVVGREGQPVEVICVIADITAYRELSELKSHMIRMASHDLKHPLAIAMGYFGVLMEDLAPLLTDQHRDMAKWVSESHDLMDGMLTELADLEQIEAKGIVEAEEIRWLPLVEKVIDQCALQIREHAHQVSFDKPEQDFTVKGETIRLHQVLFNLVSNAIKYTPDRGKIAIRIFDQDGKVYTEVQDSGVGVPRDFRPNLFKPFYRAKSPETTNVMGTGLGLSLVKSIIQQHGGDVYYRPASERGSIFGFWLPLSA